MDNPDRLGDIEKRASELADRLRSVTGGQASGDSQNAPGGGTAIVLAAYVLQLADLGGMPDTFWQTDRRVTLARQTLGIPADGRYTHQVIWENIGTGT